MLLFLNAFFPITDTALSYLVITDLALYFSRPIFIHSFIFDAIFFISLSFLTLNSIQTGEHSKTTSSISTTGNNNITTPGLVRMTDDVQRQSPPKAIVDSTPLQPQMDKNKECK